MSKKSIIALFVTGSLFASAAAQADHNSIWGAGTASMPNDIHNTRIEDDNETFLELVQGGGGADSVNRYADDSDTTTMGVAASGGVSRTTMGGSSRTATTMASRAATARVSRR